MSNNCRYNKVTSSNTIFTLRGIRPSVRPKLEEDSWMQLAVAGKRNQPDTPAPPNRVAASRFAPLGWWGVVNTRTLSETGAKDEKNEVI
jgi:hypothetical protein